MVLIRYQLFGGRVGWLGGEADTTVGYEDPTSLAVEPYRAFADNLLGIRNDGIVSIGSTGACSCAARGDNGPNNSNPDFEDRIGAMSNYHCYWVAPFDEVPFPPIEPVCARWINHRIHPHMWTASIPTVASLNDCEMNFEDLAGNFRDFIVGCGTFDDAASFWTHESPLDYPKPRRSTSRKRPTTSRYRRASIK